MSSRPLHLFIRPPYDNPPGLWTRMYSYGEIVGGAIHGHTAFRTSGSGELFAACSGKLSVRPPGSAGLDPAEEMVIPPLGQPLPDSINLYLHFPAFLTVSNPLFTSRARLINNVRGFVYLNVETSSLEASLAELLDNATIPAGQFSRDQVVELLVRGVLDVQITEGHMLGRASPNGAPAGMRQVGFAGVDDYGPTDPSHVYDWMRDFVSDGQPALDAFLTLAPKRWPVIDPAISTQDAIDLTQNAVYPMSVLQELRNSRHLTTQQWRQVGNNQKSLWRNRLLKRVGHAQAGNTDPPFEFDDLDWQNIFQLESIVEFYANFRDPWRTGAAVPGENVPLNPGDAGYTSVDFCNPGGSSATVSATLGGFEVTLDGNPDLSRVRPGYDTIWLANDTARTSRTYRIAAVNNTAIPRRVTVEGMPAISPGTTTPWEINLRPTLVIVDSFGGRENLRGNRARVVAPSQLSLDNLPNPSKINRDFDTIYLPSDTARPTRRYVITAVLDALQVVQLDGSPVLDGGESAWHIPAGLSGELPSMFYNLGPGGVRGYDHFDGVVFIIQNGVIHKQIRWTSYTSRNYAPGSQFLSSLRGNRQYDFSTYRSGNDFRNYSLKVNDVGAAYDGVREARFYFSTPVVADIAAAGFTPATDPADGGKTEIRFHYSIFNNAAHGSSSAGCIVSPNYYEMRDELIRLYQIEFAAVNGPGNQDAEVIKAYQLPNPHADSRNLWNNGNAANGLTDANWNNKIIGTLWVIRPDERPLGP